MTRETLKSNDFPIEADDKKLIKQDGQPVANAESPALAGDLAERLNEDESRKEQDRWAP